MVSISLIAACPEAPGNADHTTPTFGDHDPDSRLFETVGVPGGASRALTKAELRREKPDRHAFRVQPRLPVQVVLDGVRQGYNVGALFRLCDAFLCERLVICGRDANRGMRKLVQAAQGTHNWVPWEQRDSAVGAVLAARAEGCQVVAVEQTSDAVGLDRFLPRYPVCLVLGSERAGVSQAVLDLADAAVTIPMRGMANSLNVATAAAIVLHGLTAAHMDTVGSRTPQWIPDAALRCKCPSRI